MKKLLLVKYSPEVFLKGLNRKIFELKIRDNIKRVMNGIQYDFNVDMGRSFIEADPYDEAVDRIKNVFGVSEVCVVDEVEPNMDEFNKKALEAVKASGKKTFKIETDRANKNFPVKSMDVNKQVGAYVLKNSEGISVDVHKPECRINIEIRNKAYIYSERIKGACGLPYGMSGSTLLMLSGGIDSPVAGYRMARRGTALRCVYFHSHPYTSERAKEKVKKLAEILNGYTGDIVLYVVPFTKIQMDIIEKCREDELTILMRRFMMRIACKIAERDGINSVATGESIGQVASQTMEGLVCSDDVSDRPVFRPLISMDKEEIIDIANKIGTYDTSILPYEDCCTIFVAKHPKTKPRLLEIRRSEEKLDVDSLVDEAVKDTEIVKFN